tara:strand:+ start:1069 stop:1260 length:192 start_codon:yes stop_codon:yes gene_type:complete
MNMELKKFSCVLNLKALKEIVANVENRGFGQDNIDSGLATAVLEFVTTEDFPTSLVLTNRGEW